MTIFNAQFGNSNAQFGQIEFGASESSQNESIDGSSISNCKSSISVNATVYRNGNSTAICKTSTSDIGTILRNASTVTSCKSSISDNAAVISPAIISPNGITSAEFFGTPIIFQKTKDGLIVSDEVNNLVGTYAALGPNKAFIKVSILYGKTFKEDFKQSKNVKAKINKIEKNQKQTTVSLKSLKGGNGKIYYTQE